MQSGAFDKNLSFSDYRDINITIKNNGNENINYVKINLYFKDKNGNVIKSDWANDDSCIKSNSRQTITDTVKVTKDIDIFSTEIAEYN